MNQPDEPLFYQILYKIEKYLPLLKDGQLDSIRIELNSDGDPIILVGIPQSGIIDEKLVI